MKIRIKKGNHYPFPIISKLNPILWVSKKKKRVIKFSFEFTKSCLYDLQDEDQHDVNKLCGFSIGHHHRGSSFRFGWRPILKNGTIQIVAYEYHNGVRQKTMNIGEVNINLEYHGILMYDPMLGKLTYVVFNQNRRFNISLINNVNLKKKGGLGYMLGVYFGGNESAPHDMIIYKNSL